MLFYFPYPVVIRCCLLHSYPSVLYMVVSVRTFPRDMDVKGRTVERGGCGQQQQHHECAGCRKMIHDRYLLKCLDVYWHEDCLKCGCCNCRLGEVGQTLYTKSDLILCRRDYLRYSSLNVATN